MQRFRFRNMIAVAASLAALTTLLAVTTSSSASRRPARAGRPGSQARSLTTMKGTFVSTSGSDSNPCTHALPCRSFNAAIAQTTPGGEVIALDSGGYSAVTINGPITLVAAPGAYAAIAATSGNAITISAGTSDTVVLRGLAVRGFGATNGIDVTAVGTLHIEHLTIRNFSVDAILVLTGADANVFIDDTVLTGNDIGIELTATSGVLRASLDHVRLEHNSDYGLLAGSGAKVTVRDSVAARNGFGFSSNDSGTEINLENSVVTENTTGLEAALSATVRASNVMITDNTTGIAGLGARVSWGNNRLAGNTTDGSFSSTIPQA